MAGKGVKVVMVLLVVLLPSVTFLGIRQSERMRAARAAERGARDRREFDQFLMSQRADLAGLKVGQPFPKFATIPPLEVTSASGSDRLSLVLLVAYIPFEPDPGIFFAPIKQLLEKDAALQVRVISRDSPDLQRQIARRLSLPQVTFLHTPRDLPVAKLLTSIPMVYGIDRFGVVRGQKQLKASAKDSGLVELVRTVQR